jgi:8-oxo-dGTP pyrophosphatase MutT (NUDIX family)
MGTPGGKLEPGEDPVICVTREIFEELGIEVTVGRILDSWLYNVGGQVEVLIVTYGCKSEKMSTIVLSHEHKAVSLFAVGEIDSLRMPEGYRASIRQWAAEVFQR